MLGASAGAPTCPTDCKANEQCYCTDTACMCMAKGAVGATAGSTPTIWQGMDGLSFDLTPLTGKVSKEQKTKE